MEEKITELQSDNRRIENFTRKNSFQLLRVSKKKEKPTHKPLHLIENELQRVYAKTNKLNETEKDRE